MVNGVIFDMDGLIFDTERLSTEGWIYCGEKLGIDLDRKFINSFKGTAKKYSEGLFKAKFGNNFDYEAARQIRTDYMLNYVNEKGVPIKKGLLELLIFFKERKVKCAVATSTGRELAKLYFNKSKIAEYFDEFVYGDVVERGKPEPDIFLKALEVLGVKNEECIILEDSPAGIIAGNKANIRVIAVADMCPLFKDDLERVECCVGSLDIVKDIFDML